MSLSKRSVQMLLDLVEIKISFMDVSDREDARDLQVLERAREELKNLTSAVGHSPVESGPNLVRRAHRPRVAA